jgi:hypothetical protein
MKKFSADVDIDFADREQILKHIKYTPAGMIKDHTMVRHNTGIYVNPIPANPFSGISNIDYQTAENIGYIKLDLLNNSVYSLVRDEAHLLDLMNRTPPWNRLREREFMQKVVHIGNHYDTMIRMPEPVDSITRMAMFLAVIRPAKRHLIGLPWKKVAETVWETDVDAGYQFKKSHSISYSFLVVVHMNVLAELSN